MLLLSVSPQHHTLFSVSRVSSSSSLSSSSRLPLLPKLTSSIFARSTARRFPCALTFASKVRSMAELVEDKEAGVAVVASGSGEGTEESKGLNRSHTFLDARTEEALLAGIREETVAGRLPPNVASGMEELYQNYRNAVNKYS